MSNKTKWSDIEGMAGAAIVMLVLIGFGGIVHVLFTGSGVGLIASAIAFGAIAHVAYG